MNKIESLDKALRNKFWDYSAEYMNYNGYRNEKEITPDIKKRLLKLREAIDNILTKIN